MNGTTIYEAAKYWFPLLKLALMPLALLLLLIPVPRRTQ